MIKNAQNANIPLNKGISRTPAVAEEGELSTCVNLIPRGGELKPIAPPTAIEVELEEGETLVGIHRVGTETHYLVTLPGVNQGRRFIGLYWFSESSPTRTRIYRYGINLPLPKIQASGNVLFIVQNEETVHYYIWRDGEYQDLGAGLPDVKVQLALGGELQMGSYSALLDFVSGPAAGGYNYQSYIDSVHDTTDQLDGHTRYVWVALPADKPLESGYAYRITNTSGWETTVIWTYGQGNKFKIILKPGASDDIVILPGFTVIAIRLSAYKTGGDVELSVKIEKGTYNDSLANYIPDETVENLEALKSVANSFINTAMQQDGKFVLPFFARVGLRLYDGSIVNLSPPILMLPNTGNAPAMIVLNGNVQSVSRQSVSAFGYQCDLMYKISSADLALLQSEGWTDLITGLVFAVSRPIYTYNEGYVFNDDKQNLPTSELFYSHDQGIIGGLSPIQSVSGTNAEYGWHEIGKDIASLLNLSSSDNGKKYLQVHLPSFTDAEVHKSFTDKGDFYVLDEIKISDLEADTLTALDLKEKDLTGAASWERINDSENRSSVSGKISFEYNSRLHIANTSETVWPGNSPLLLQGYDNDNGGQDSAVNIRAIVKIVTDGQEVYADTGVQSGTLTNEKLYWFSYPDSNAVSAKIYLKRGSLYFYADISLHKHDFMNLAYWFEDLAFMPFKTPTTQPEIEAIAAEMVAPVTGNTLYYPNKLYVSDAVNPFIFRSQSHVRVGSGEIRGLATAAQALSQGQFGQYPLYVFCSDGIWALEVGSTGVYEAAKPVSRDVLTNPDSVTQLDNAVAFVTDKGLMCISGSKVELLSGKLDGLVPDDDFIGETLQTFGTKISKTVPFVSHAAQSSEFKTLVQNAKIVYDYAGSRLHVFTDGDILHYVYSLKTGEWASQILDSDYDLLSIVPGYPETLLQFAGKEEIYSYKATPASEPIVCYALTRSIPFGAPFTRKMLADLRLLGQRTGSDNLRRIAVYISDDEVTWKKLTSLHRMSAKYFRFLVMGYLYEGQSLSGIVAQIVEKYTNKMR